MKDCCIIMDTNILTEYKSDLTSIKEVLIASADIFIPRIVIEEIQGQKVRIIKEDYDKIKTSMKKHNGIFKFSENFNLDNEITRVEQDIANWFEKYCDNNVIEYKNIKLSEVIKRSKYKIAPFINESNSSDKGFKDSLIWMSILKSYKLKSYKNIVLFTNDRAGFIKQKNDLLDELKKNDADKLVFISSLDELYKFFKINSNVESDELIGNNVPIVDVNVENINDIRSRLNICINNILFDVYEDNFGNEYTRQNFNIYKEMTNEDAECFLNLLNNFLLDNIFSYNLDISELLIGCGIESSGENVSSDSLRELNDIFNSIKNNKELCSSLLTFITKEFNKLYKPKPVIHNIFDDFDDSDIPF